VTRQRLEGKWLVGCCLNKSIVTECEGYKVFANVDEITDIIEGKLVVVQEQLLNLREDVVAERTNLILL